MEHISKALIPRSNASEAIAAPSLTPSELAAGAMLDLTASMTNRTILETEALFWREILAPYPPELIRRAFKEHLRKCKFFPHSAEILEQLNGWMDERRAGERERAARRSKEELDAAVARGEAQQFGSMKELLNNLLQEVEKRKAGSKL